MKYQFFNCASDMGVCVDDNLKPIIHNDGAHLGPKAICEALHIKNAITIAEDETQEKDYNPNSKLRNLKEVNRISESIYKEITNHPDTFNIALGGDHSISIASVLASQKIHHNVGVIWIDSHGDFNTEKSTSTHNLHGLPLAAINGFGCPKLTTFYDGAYVNSENIVIYGARDIDEWEMPNLIHQNIKIITTEEIKKEGVSKTLKEAFRYLKEKTNQIHISFDLDSLDPSIVPGVTIPEENGLNKEELESILNELKKEADTIVSLDVVELNPLRDVNNQTLNIACHIIKSLIPLD